MLPGLKGCSVLITVTAILALPSCGPDRESKSAPAGDKTSPKTEVLKLGAKSLQTNAPLEPFNVYLVGFHPMKNDPSHQMEAHHFCAQVNEDFAQCALFDGNTQGANLNGIEYIISAKLFDTLPPEERQYWHPHNGEILSGQLVAPGLPDVAEKELMQTKMNSYGKTWHVWGTDQGHKLPIGEPMLAWSFSRDGELRQSLLEDRVRKMKIDTSKIRQQRQELKALAKPQEGVDVLKGKFGPVREIPGVVNASEQSGPGGGKR